MENGTFIGRPIYYCVIRLGKGKTETCRGAKRLIVKKKHIKALNSLAKWLKERDSLPEAAYQGLKEALEAQAEDEVEVSDGSLPAPKEIENEPMTIALYADGGCRGNPGPGAFAFVIQKHDGTVLSEGAEYESMTTNNKMELSGALKGLEESLDIIPEPLLAKVKVITDSKYVVDGMKSWVAGWKAKGWKKADGKAPENLELWQSLDFVRTKFMQVEWQWVKGHAGHPQNEYCDRKANELMDRYMIES